ncbi:MAG TPA: aminoglycoside phosphotransferase family protein [Streptosporangiaceae bacterium]|nr:aminoglycoside phosphotransferase family protein [Streptosporangiaceae bacterium]
MVSFDLSERTALALLQEACEADGLSAEDASLMRLGSNAVFHLKAPVVVRISRQGTDVNEAVRTVAVARWLEAVDYPAVRVVDVDQPIVLNGHVVTFWEAVSRDGQQFATVGEFAEILARLHRLDAPADLHLPALAPFDNSGQRILANEWLSPGDREFLTEHLSGLQSAYARLEFVLPPGVIHGDANVGNVLRDSHDKPVVIDLDGFAVGPREWDVALTAIYYDSFGWHTREEYETFVRVYGFDVMQWSGYPVMRAVREFLMVTWLIQQAGQNERSAAEAAKRINALRTGASRRDWKPY